MEYRFVDRWIAYKRNIQKVRDSSLNTYKMNIVSLLDELNKTKQLKSEIELYKSITRFDLEDLINDKINKNTNERIYIMINTEGNTDPKHFRRIIWDGQDPVPREYRTRR